jgi:hypothetical protein
VAQPVLKRVCGPNSMTGWRLEIVTRRDWQICKGEALCAKAKENAGKRRLTICYWQPSVLF